MHTELTQAGIFFIPATLLLCILAKPSWMVLWTALLAPFEAASVLNIYVGHYVFGVQPGYLGALALLVSVGMRVLLRGRIPNGRRLSFVYAPLILFAVYAVASAAVIPELLAGRIEVFPPREGIALANLAPLQPSATNISQALYIVFLAAVAFAVSSVVAQTGNGATVLKAYVIGGVLVSVVGLYQLLAFYLGWPYPYEFLSSNPGYFQGYSWLLGQAKRISGTLTEPSVFAYYLTGILSALAGIYLFAQQRFWLCLLAAFISVMLLISTSTTAYISIAVLCLVLLVVAMRSKTSRPRMVLHGLGLVALGAPIFLLAWKSGVEELATYVVRSTILEKATSLSFTDRVGTDLHSLALVADSYGLGVGWGSNRSSSLLTNLISNAGIPGTVLLIIFAMRVVRLTRGVIISGNPDRSVAIPLVLSAFAMLVAGTISNPDITHVVFWVNLGALVGLGLAKQRADASPSRALSEGYN